MTTSKRGGDSDPELEMENEKEGGKGAIGLNNTSTTQEKDILSGTKRDYDLNGSRRKENQPRKRKKKLRAGEQGREGDPLIRFAGGEERKMSFRQPG